MNTDRFDNLSLRWKISGNLLIIFLLLTANLAGVWLFLSEQDQDGTAIDMAGKQRMLLERMALEAHMIRLGESGERDALRSAANQYNRSLTLLISGDQSRGIPPAPPEVRPQLQEIRAQWHPFQENIRTISASDRRSPEFDAAFDYVQRNKEELLVETDRAVQLYEAAYEAKVERLRQFLLSLFVLDSIAVGALLIFSNRRIIDPIDRLVRDANSVARGELDRRINTIPTNDEVGTLTKSIERMKDRLVTALRDARSFHQAVENAGHAICITEPDGSIRYINPAFEEQTGLRKHEAMGNHLETLIEDGTDDESSIHIWETVQDEGVWEGEVLLSSTNDEPITVNQTVREITDDSGTIEGIVSISDDITDRKLREQKLRRQNERLEQFASIVSHDLMNPLSVAIGGVELVNDDCGSVHLEKVENALQRMENLLRDLLAIAKSGQPIQDVDTVNVDQVARRAWSMAKGDEFSSELVIQDRIGTIEADESRLQELFENLLQNAIQHAGPEVTVTVGRLNNGFYVADDGPGIAFDVADRIFEAGVSTRIDGTGFGLNIVEEIVEAHGWSISVCESEAGGARFEISDVGPLTEQLGRIQGDDD